jgi:hypothetical protein
MKTHYLPAFLVGAALCLVAAPAGMAAKVTPSEFKAQLNAALGNKKGSAAYNKGAKFFQKTLRDKRNKKYASKYANFLTKAMRGGRVKIALLGRATNTFTKGLLAGYFSGKSFDLYDKEYNKAFTKLVKPLPLSQKTVATSQALYNTIKTYSARKGVGQDEVFAYYMTVDTKNRLPEPVS